MDKHRIRTYTPAELLVALQGELARNPFLAKPKSQGSSGESHRDDAPPPGGPPAGGPGTPPAA
jgi:hypothetical protein